MQKRWLILAYFVMGLQKRSKEAETTSQESEAEALLFTGICCACFHSRHVFHAQPIPACCPLDTRNSCSVLGGSWDVQKRIQGI